MDWTDFNKDEQKVILTLVEQAGALTLKELTAMCWARSHGTDETSRTRNNLRRPVREGWVWALDGGGKQASTKARAELSSDMPQIIVPKKLVPVAELERQYPAETGEIEELDIIIAPTIANGKAVDAWDLDDPATKEAVAIDLLAAHGGSDTKAHKADPRFSRGYLIGVKKRHKATVSP